MPTLLELINIGTTLGPDNCSFIDAGGPGSGRHKTYSNWFMPKELKGYKQITLSLDKIRPWERKAFQPNIDNIKTKIIGNKKLPLVEVQLSRNFKITGLFSIADGHHRYNALKQLGYTHANFAIHPIDVVNYDIKASTEKWNGLDISIQTPAGGIRRGVDKQGNHWSNKIPYAYGEIIGTEGIDKEPVDCYVGDYPKSQNVYIVKMPKDKSGEDKCMIGFLTLSQAKKGFLSCYGGDISFFGSIREVSISRFKHLLVKRKGKNLIAMSDMDFDVSYRLTPLEPLPTGWNTEVENPGDRKLTPEERRYNTELARHQGGEPSYATVATVARTWSVPYVYSSKNNKRRLK
jgi:hypothetical protein